MRTRARFPTVVALAVLPRRLTSAAALGLLSLLAACSGSESTSPGGGTPVLTSVLLSAQNGTISVGATSQLTAVAKDQNGKTMTATITWASSNSSVASVSASGLVTALAVGTTSISASSGGVNAAPLAMNVISAGGGTYPLAAEVYMPGNIYSPFVTDIARTGTVSFIFPPDADGHNVIFRATPPGAPANIDILKNTTQSRQFNTVGTFTYDCTVHPGMTALIVVH